MYKKKKMEPKKCEKIERRGEGKEGNTLNVDDWPEIPEKEGSLITKTPAASFILAKCLFSNT